GEHGLEDRPDAPDQRLLVAHLQVAPDEDPEQVAETPKLAEVQTRPVRRRADHRHVGRTRRGRTLAARWRLSLGNARLGHPPDASREGGGPGPRPNRPTRAGARARRGGA